MGLPSAGRDKDERRAPILLVAIFTGFPAHGTLFSIADGVDARGINPLFDQEFLDAIGAPVAQRKVVFLAASFVTMAFNPELETAMFF